MTVPMAVGKLRTVGEKRVADTVQVTRAEEALYGPLAPAVRKLGNALQAVEEARQVTIDLLNDSREADSLSAGLVTPPEDIDAHGEGEWTRWLDSLYSRLYDYERAAGDIFREVAQEAADRETEHRKSVDSLSAVPVMPGFDAFQADVVERWLREHGFHQASNGLWGHEQLGEGRPLDACLAWALGRDIEGTPLPPSR